jgi:hypothetical protein
LYDILQRMQTIIEQLQKKKWEFDIEIKELHERCEIRRRIDRDVKTRRKTRREILQFEDDQTDQKIHDQHRQRRRKKEVERSDHQKHHEKNARRRSSKYHSTRERGAENTDEVDED